MVHFHRILLPQQKKPDLEQQGSFKLHSWNKIMSYDYYLSIRNHRSNTGYLRLLLLFSMFSFILLFSPRLFFSSFYTLENQEENWPAPCSNMQNSAICCDRTALRTDVCFMRGDVRTDSSSNSFFLVSGNSSNIDEKIRPYTRKWETSVMSTIDELHLKMVSPQSMPSKKCDVVHNVPAVVFSTGGYTGNVYHEFNDGIIPLYITSQKFNGEVVFVMLEYHDWWMTKYGYVVSRLSNYPAIDFSNDKRTHCFSEVIVGLRIHDELAIDPAKMDDHKTIRDFRNLLDEAYKPRIRGIIKEEAEKPRRVQKAQRPSNTQNQLGIEKPKLVIISRNGSRKIENEGRLVKLAKEVGFNVEILRPKRSTELEKIYMHLNSSDVMVGVHGAAMTHFLFMRPGSVFIQVVPLGTDWAAETYYGEPAVKLGLRYINYKILPKESSLYEEYKKDDPVLRDPDSINAKGWQYTKKVYLDGQNVKLDLVRFRKRLIRAYQYILRRRQQENIMS
ncbi:Glycosyltransferase family 61 protein [Rhynchospora pubera]|uniref:Glycosyltransferase family 61 protein n=1 Tax=Rhynchospora pubera TaxID=906938 RepID=A0AAV8HQ06_9POAL|nr:Glycosyltransferase family 61 protein [Rhynchospora pubera]